MNARKGIAIAGAVLVITSASLGWFIINRPPFRFLAGAEQCLFVEEKRSFRAVFLDRSSLPVARTGVFERYVSKRAYADLTKEAEAEIRKAGPTEAYTSWDRSHLDDRFIRLSPGASVHIFANQGQVWIDIHRELTPLDRLRLLVGKKEPKMPRMP